MKSTHLRSLFVGLFLLAFLIEGQAQSDSTRYISGVVSDSARNTHLEGVSVLVKGTTIKAVSDVHGAFKIEATALQEPVTLIFDGDEIITQEVVVAVGQTSVNVALSTATNGNNITITSRRRVESAQDVQIPVTVVGGAQIDATGGFNVNRVKELIPTVQLYSSNPRNTSLNVRGLGSPFGLTNDGIDPGVGFYIDGVYYARPAATTLDFIDVEQIEVLRGPQGTLFGKNTTSGAFNITTRKPSFKPGANFELSYGNYGYVQGKASITGPLSKKFAARLSFSGTQRNGTIYNVRTDEYINDINNLGVRGQLLYLPSDKFKVTLSADYTTQRPHGYAQVVAGVVTTKRAAYRQFNAIISDLNYSLPSTNAFDRTIDHNTTWKSGNDLAGGAVNMDWKIGKGTLTSTTAFRYWMWDPSNDRDFTGLAVLQKSQASSEHIQYSQEIRYSGTIVPRVNTTIGLFAIGQNLWTSPYHVEESGDAQWRFSQSSTSPLWATPGLLDGYGIKTKSTLNTVSAAVFANADWEVVSKFHIMAGLRLNYDEKFVNYNRQTYGGLQTTDPALIAIKKSVYSDQAFTANTDNTNLSGNLTVSYKASKRLNAYATYATGYKPVGVNLGGLPTSAGQPMLELAVVKPEYVKNIEIGVKTSPTSRTTANFTFFHTTVDDYQAQVQSPEVGVNRGYLANAEQVRVFGFEFDGKITVSNNLSFYGNVAYTDGIYSKFTNAPLPLEETGATVSYKDISGGRLPGISQWAGSVGGEVSTNDVKFWGRNASFFLGADSYLRSGFSSSPSPSQYLNVDGYGLLNARVGFRTKEGLTFFVWGRNILNQNYYEQLLVAAGNAGQYAGVLGDPRTYGVTLRQSF